MAWLQPLLMHLAIGICAISFQKQAHPSLMKLLQRMLFAWKYALPIYAVVHAVMLNKKHWRSTTVQEEADQGTNKWRQISFAILYKQALDQRSIAESLHAYINRATLAACEASIFFREISHFSKISPSPSLRSHLGSSPMGIFLTDYGSFLSLVGECRVNCQTEPHDHALGLGSLHFMQEVWPNH